MIEFGLVETQGHANVNITGTGDAFKIFATVAEILKQSVANSGAEYIMFSGSLREPSRIKLYDAFIKFLPKFLPGWQAHETKPHHNIGQKQYVLKKSQK